MKRRGFLKLAGALSTVGFAPEILWAAAPSARSGNKQAKPIAPRSVSGKTRRVVLIKLVGGNDGLSTLIPTRDKEYNLLRDKYRPNILHAKHQLQELPDSNGLALNPYMAPLQRWWKSGHVAWIQGVGYHHPILSHFRSSDIWETASNAFEYSDIGWLTQILPRYKEGLHGIIIGEGLGPMLGKDCHTIAMQSPQVFLNQVDLIDDISPSRHPSQALTHIVNIQHQLHAAGKQLKQKMSHPKPLGGFATGTLGRQLESIAQMIINDVDTAVYKIEHKGFDTHSKQLITQNHLLRELSVALDSFANAMQRHGRWDEVMVITYSEFGRRVAENHGKGTDHGAASVQLVMGGKVRGGIYGDRPPLHDLDKDGNLHMTTDFRKVYGTVASRWLGVANPWRSQGILPFV